MIKWAFPLLMAMFISCTSWPNNSENSNTIINMLNTTNTIGVPDFMGLVLGGNDIKKESLQHIKDNWQAGYEFPLVEVLRFASSESTAFEAYELLREKTGMDKGNSHFDWLTWLWTQEPNYPSFYADLKGELYRHIDPRFEMYFKGRQNDATIRLDEIVWGGVEQDGIPPLRFPNYLSADEADYLEDDNVVFGFFLNGIARAYPKRILAWHEFFVDKFGDLQVAGVYCTLCGTVIAYDMTHKDVLHDLGTSGFLYRSNKLMYDRNTQSLWNTVEGKPVLGPLHNEMIDLESHYLVTTTWGEWKALYPDTEVLSLTTGHRRNYDEGVAYQEYFANDELMFPVPNLDKRIANKQEVFVLRVDGYKQDPLAISADFLAENRIYSNKIGDTEFTILTSESGANRAYENKINVIEIVDARTVKTNDGKSYIVKEDGIYDGKNMVAKRLPSHRIFWFAWFNTYRNTRLVS